MEAPIPRDVNGNYNLPNGYKAVTGEKVLASQHNPPLEDLAAAMTDSLPRNGRAPMLGPFNMNGFPLINMPDGADPTSPVTKSQLDAAIASIVAAVANAAPTGAVQGFRLKSPPPGWIKENGGTIGNASSGATTRANADTEALFTVFWTQYTNAELPIFTSTGAASTRGASAAVDFAAGKRIAIHNSRSFFHRGADDGFGYDPALVVGLSQGDTLKYHGHGVNDPGHGHFYTAFATVGNAAGGGSIISAWAGTQQYLASTALTGITIQPTGDAETRPRASVVLYCVKL